jgi:uncharacterized damage-inducible protein DinB
MTKADIELLYEYDRWANHRVIDALAPLTHEQLHRDLSGSFPSVCHTMLHIIGGEWIWLQFWAQGSPSDEVISRLRQKRDELFHPNAVPTIEAVRQKWAEVEAAQLNFVAGLTDAVLEQSIPFRGANVKLVELMQHVANHSTYHRGQITLMMRQLGAQPMSTDFHVFLVETRRETLK